MKNRTTFLSLVLVLLSSGSALYAQDTLRAFPQGVNPGEAPPPDFIMVDREPQIIKQSVPYYPELAQKAGMEGRVIVKIWINREGKPNEALVLKSDAEIFNRPAVEAAMKYRFTPAVLDNKPVGVWVVIPFTFKLKPSPTDEINSSEPGVPPSQGQRQIIENAGLNSPSTTSKKSIEEVISFYNSGMKYEREKKYTQAVERYRYFLAGARTNNMNLDEMVRHAKLMIQKYGKMPEKEK